MELRNANAIRVFIKDEQRTLVLDFKNVKDINDFVVLVDDKTIKLY